MFEDVSLVTMVVGGLTSLLGLTTLVAISLRRVVPTNEVHIVQSANTTSSYGKDTGNGNVYYQWPTSMPVLGVTRIILPVSIFDIDLKGYEAYDRGRLPFMVDVKAFFRIADSNIAAQRISSAKELQGHLQAVVQGAIRSILATNDIETIMQDRSKFGTEFTAEVNGNLKEWGVATVKSIELMDIRDDKDSRVIRNIMEKKKSHIEMESRTEVAKNNKLAEIAEIEAKREVDLQNQAATQAVGLRKVEAQREVELQNQSALQSIKESERATKEKEMAVERVKQLRTAEITKDTLLVKAEQDKQVAILTAEANLESQRRSAEGVKLQGEAKANAEKALLLAPVEAQTTLAKEIGENISYQNYLITLKRVEAEQAVGIAQAEALTKADVKVISNTGSPSAGVKSVMDLFSSKGGTEVGAMLEGLAQTETGQNLISKFIGSVPPVVKDNSPAKALAAPKSNGKVQ